MSTTPIHSLTFYLIEFFQLPLVSIDCWQVPRFDTGGLFSQDPAISYVRSEKNLNDDQRRAIQKVTNFPLLILYDVLFFLVTLTNVFYLKNYSLECLFNTKISCCNFQILTAKDYALILGMPGTGKTFTMVHAVKALLIRGASILITSYTNSAIDNLLIKLKSQVVLVAPYTRYFSPYKCH